MTNMDFMCYIYGMNTTLVLISGIVFLLVGLIFCAIAFYLKTPKFIEKAPIGKIAGSIFYIIGSLTFVMGLLAIIFHSEASKAMVQFGFLIYLVILTIILFIFVSLLKDTGKNER